MGHTASVEDLQVHIAFAILGLDIFRNTLNLAVIYNDDLFLCLQWSPTEPCVFASASVDGTVAIWDTRAGKSPAVSIKAHKADVNVITWNRCS